MAEQISDRRVFSLHEVAISIQKTLSERYTSAFWVKAEMNKLNRYPHSGHCYPELLEKKDGKVTAQLKAHLWRDDYVRINERFLSVLGEPLKDGITVLFAARISFDPVHGLSLRMVDIDPVFSLGELEREKQETILRLKREALFGANKERPFPLLPKRIALISVQTSKGYADFQQVLEGNPWGYAFTHVLFPSLLQGERAIDSILQQLKRIRRVARYFDVVAIVRGGGGDVGLSFLNNYTLAAEVARFPLPVLTGIGHATNETVVEMVAYKNAITPTELADFLLQKFHQFAVPVQQAAEIIRNKSKQQLSQQREQFQFAIRHFKSATVSSLRGHRVEIKSFSRSLGQESVALLNRSVDLLDRYVEKISIGSQAATKRLRADLLHIRLALTRETDRHLGDSSQQVMNIEKTIHHLDPVNVLRRGYSITTAAGTLVTAAAQVKPGDAIVTHLAEGLLESKIVHTKPPTSS